MARSSIFSFERPLGFPRGLALAAALLLIVELVVARDERVWAAVPHSDVGVVDVLEREVIAVAERPRVLVLGNSRARDAVVPRALERALGLPRGSVLNLALTRGTAFDADALLERNADALADVELVLFNVDLIQLDGTLAPNERVRRLATLRERATEHPPVQALPLVVGWVWRTYDARDAIRRALATTWRDPPPGVPLAADGRVRWRTAAMNRRAHRISMRRYARNHLARFEVEPRYVRRIDRLVERVRREGREIVLFEVPFRDEFVREARRHHGSAWTAYRTALDGLRERHGLVTWAGSVALGLKPADFHDYGHLRDVGARRFTRALARRIAASTAWGSEHVEREFRDGGA